MRSSLGDASARSTWIFCIGQMKAGTTWFYDSTLGSADIYTPPVKETRILSTFDRFGTLGLLDKLTETGLAGIPGFERNQVKTFLEYPRVFVKQFATLYETIGSQPLTPAIVGQLEWWLSYLRDPWTPETFTVLAGLRHEKYSIDASPCNLLVSHRSLTLLEKAVPNPKVILLLRHPLRRLFSALWMHAELRQMLTTGSWQSLVEFSGRAGQYSILCEQHRHSFVVEAVSAWRHIYGDENIFVIIVEEMSRHHENIQQRLNEFLGINSLELLHTPRNQSHRPELNMAVAEFLETMVEGVSQKVTESLNIRLPNVVSDQAVWDDSTEIQSGPLADRCPAPTRVESPMESLDASFLRSSATFLGAFDEREWYRLGRWYEIGRGVHLRDTEDA